MRDLFEILDCCHHLCSLCGGYWILLISLQLQVVSRWSNLSSRVQRASQVERNDHLFGLCTTKICWNNLKIMLMIITGNLHTSVPLQGGEWRTHERQRCRGGERERRRMQIANENGERLRMRKREVHPLIRINLNHCRCKPSCHG